MKKQLKVSLTISAALLAMAGIAQAAPFELNIYGASAQYSYWNAQAQKYAQSLGCTASAPALNGKAHGMVTATNCTSTLVPVNAATGKRDLEIRYSGIASAEGPLAVLKQAPLDPALASGCSIANGERKMFATTSSTVCKQVHVGTSDVAGESLVQSSSGMSKGMLGGVQTDTTMSAIDTSSLTPSNTVVVPFGFFVNSAVKAQTCTTGLIGNYCTANTQCDTAPSNATGTCGAAATITNISREEATLLFSGTVTNWSDLGAYFTAQPVIACLRHAGSGTHSALDLTVMNSGWGNNTATAESAGNIYFNQSSGDEMACVNGATTASPTGSLIGAIGYADADQVVGAANVSQNVNQMKYNGFYPTRSAIRNGLYDFYTNAWLYTNPANNALNNALAADMVIFAQQPANVPASKANYWASIGEMKFNRQADAAYPVNAFADPALVQNP